MRIKREFEMINYMIPNEDKQRIYNDKYKNPNEDKQWIYNDKLHDLNEDKEVI